MAGECTHTKLPETTVKQCFDGSSLKASGHESYLKIIDDLKKDLEQISCEFIMVQKECIEHDQGYETNDAGLEISLRELEIHNDRLEQALKLQTQTKEAALMELQTNNESLKCQIAHLQHAVIERDQHIMQLSSMLKSIPPINSTEPRQAALEYVTSLNVFPSDLEKKLKTLSEKLEKTTKQEQFLRRETRKLNEDLNDSKKKNRDLITQAHRVSHLLKSEENHRKELAARYEALEQSYEDQAKKLRAANSQLCALDERFQLMEKRQIEHNTERNFLREEVLSLKEKHAYAISNQKSIQEQQIKTEKELYTAHDVIREQEGIMKRTETSFHELQRRMQETIADLKKKIADLIKDYQKLQQEYDKQKEINAEQNKLIENFRKWKEQQLRAEQSTRDGLKMYQDCMRDMLEDKEKLLSNYHDLSKEYSMLQNELDRLKMCSLSLSPFNNLLNASERSIAERLEIVRRTTTRISDNSSLFKDEEPNASRGGSSSVYRPSEEPL